MATTAKLIKPTNLDKLSLFLTTLFRMPTNFDILFNREFHFFESYSWYVYSSTNSKPFHAVIVYI